MARRADGEGTITKRADGRWEGRLSLGHDGSGKRNRHVVYGRTQKEVRAKLDDLRSRLSSGYDGQSDLQTKAYLELWMIEKARTLKPSTIEQYRLCIDRHINPRIGHIRLGKLKPLQVQRLVGEVADAAGPAPAAKCRIILHGAFKQAIRWSIVSRNPVEAVEPPVQPKREMKVWSSQQAEAFLRAAKSHRLYALFYLAIATGMRRGELLALQWGDISDSAVTVRHSLVKVSGGLVSGTPKTTRGFRRIPVAGDVLIVLAEHRRLLERESREAALAWPAAYDEYVFRSEVGTPVDPDNLRRAKRRLMEEAGVPQVSLHDLRHLHSSLCIRRGMDPKLLADRLGHQRASFTLDRYTHLFDEQREASAISVADWLSEASTQPQWSSIGRQEGTDD